MGDSQEKVKVGRPLSRSIGRSGGQSRLPSAPPSAPRPPAPVDADGALQFGEDHPAEEVPAPSTPPGPPQTLDEAKLRFLERYGEDLLMLLFGERTRLPETVDNWIELARRTRDALADPTLYTVVQLRRIAEVLEEQRRQAQKAAEAQKESEHREATEK